MVEATLTMEGHILDSLLLPKVLDAIVAGGGEYEIQEITIGRTRHDASRAKLKVTAANDAVLRGIVSQAKEHGARESG